MYYTTPNRHHHGNTHHITNTRVPLTCERCYRGAAHPCPPIPPALGSARISAHSEFKNPKRPPRAKILRCFQQQTNQQSNGLAAPVLVFFCVLALCLILIIQKRRLGTPCILNQLRTFFSQQQQSSGQLDVFHGELFY